MLQWVRSEGEHTGTGAYLVLVHGYEFTRISACFLVATSCGWLPLSLLSTKLSHIHVLFTEFIILIYNCTEVIIYIISINFYFNRFYQSFHLIKNIFGSKREHGMLPDDRRGYSAVDILMIWFLWPFGEEDIDFFLCFSLMCQKWDIELRAVIYEALRIIESVSHTFDCRVVPGVSFLRGQRRHFHGQMNSRFCLLKQREFDKNRKRRLQFITWFHIQRWSMEVLCWTIE